MQKPPSSNFLSDPSPVSNKLRKLAFHDLHSGIRVTQQKTLCQQCVVMATSGQICWPLSTCRGSLSANAKTCRLMLMLMLSQWSHLGRLCPSPCMDWPDNCRPRLANVNIPGHFRDYDRMLSKCTTLRRRVSADGHTFSAASRRLRRARSRPCDRLRRRCRPAGGRSR
jgi:hypothetical protein